MRSSGYACSPVQDSLSKRDRYRKSGWDRIGVDDLPPELGAAPPTVQTADDVRTLAEVERDYIAAALRASGGNRPKAAEKLGIGAATVYRKLKQARP